MKALPLLRVGLDTLRSLFFPSHCAGCGERVEEGWFCRDCRADIQPVGTPRCEVCSRPFPATGSFVCVNCQDRHFHFRHAVAVLRSRGVVRDMIHRLKYGGETWLLGPLGEFLHDGLEDERLAGRPIDALVPVPLHPRRRRERDYNQAALLAGALRRATRIPVLDALKRERYTVTQTHFDRRQRMQNLRDAFSLRQNAPVQGKHLLLIDDVFTTGSTLDECARTLQLAGSASVTALTLARG